MRSRSTWSSCSSVWRLLRRGVGAIAAVVATLWFATHPLHVEAVASAANSSELLVVGWTFALAMVIRGQPSDHGSREREWTGALTRRGAHRRSRALEGIGTILAAARRAHGVGLDAAPGTSVATASFSASAHVSGSPAERRSSPRCSRARWCSARRWLGCPSRPLDSMCSRRSTASWRCSRSGRAYRPHAALAGTALSLLRTDDPSVEPHRDARGSGGARGDRAVAGIRRLVRRVVAERRPLVALGWIVLTYLPAANLLTATGQIIADRTLFGATGRRRCVHRAGSSIARRASARGSRACVVRARRACATRSECALRDATGRAIARCGRGSSERRPPSTVATSCSASTHASGGDTTRVGALGPRVRDGAEGSPTAIRVRASAVHDGAVRPGCRNSGAAPAQRRRTPRAGFRRAVPRRGGPIARRGGGRRGGNAAAAREAAATRRCTSARHEQLNSPRAASPRGRGFAAPMARAHRRRFGAPRASWFMGMSRTPPTRAPRTLAADLDAHCARLAACRRCAHGPAILPIVSHARAPRAMLVGQAPGQTEIGGGRPFAGRAGRTLFRWLERAGLDEATAREWLYISAITRCYPGPHPGGRGDRVPSTAERERCADWLDEELRIVKPILLIPVGRLAIDRFLGARPLAELVGREHAFSYDGGEATVIPLPHPSGASSWVHGAENRALLERALDLLGDRFGTRAREARSVA